jgi:hypothetical protein
MMCGNGHLDGQVISLTSKSIHHDHIVDLVVLFDGQPTAVPIRVSGLALPAGGVDFGSRIQVAWLSGRVQSIRLLQSCACLVA